MRFFNPLAPRPKSTAAQLEQVKAWTREFLGLDGSEVIAVSELACRDAGCPGLETVIGVFRVKMPTRMFKIAKPLAEVSRDDVAAVARPSPPASILPPQHSRSMP